MNGRPVTRICFVGDSLTLGVGDPEGRGWAGRLLQSLRLGGVDVTGYNLGIRRDTSLDISRRWRSEVEARLPPTQQGAIVFAFGTNDCLEENGSVRVERARTLEIAGETLRAALAIAPVLMIGPPPALDAGENERIQSLSVDLEGLCSQLGVPYFDSFAALQASPEWRNDLEAGDGYHPSARGYEALAVGIGSWPGWNSLFA